MAKVLMLKTVLGCDTGIIYPTEYVEGEMYSIGDELSGLFVADGNAELADDSDAPTSADDRETKSSKSKVKK